MQTSGANKNPLYLSVLFNSYSLEIDTEFPLGNILRMAHF